MNTLGIPIKSLKCPNQTCFTFGIAIKILLFWNLDSMNTLACFLLFLNNNTQLNFLKSFLLIWIWSDLIIKISLYRNLMNIKFFLLG